MPKPLLVLLRGRSPFSELKLPRVDLQTIITRTKCTDSYSPAISNRARISSSLPMPDPNPSMNRVPDPASCPTSAASAKKQANFYRRVLPETCIAFGSDEGKLIFKEALMEGHMDCYFGLAAQFRTQDEPAYCGLSTLVMVLNTLQVDPKKIWKGVWRWYHENMLDCCVPLGVIAQKGITFNQFACLAACNNLSVETVRGTRDSSEEAFRQAVMQYTRTSDHVIVASYSRKDLEQTGDGHFSPIGGYHKERDLVLILDTARFKYPPHWVPLSTLHTAMKRHDPDTDEPRGYYILTKSQQYPLVLFRIAAQLLPQETPSKTSTFMDEWKAWYQSVMLGVLDDSTVLQLAVNQILHSLRHLVGTDGESDPSEHLLTTQLDVTCPEKLTDGHSCAVQELLKGLEKLRLFCLIRDEIANVDARVLTGAGLTTNKVRGCLKYGIREKCYTKVDVRPEHFLTMLLLSWPYVQCERQSVYGHQIVHVVMSQLANTSPVLQNEVAQLRQQLHLVLDYSSSCTHCKMTSGCRFGSTTEISKDDSKKSDNDTGKSDEYDTEQSV